MKYWKIALIMVVTIFSTQLISAQSFDKSQLSKIEVDQLSDEQIQLYWDKAKAEGYSMDQLEVIAKANGMPSYQFSKLKQRINNLKYSDSNTVSQTGTSKNTAEISNLEKFGLEGKVATQIEKNPLFGFDFFSNPNISFTPNLNLATPATYQLGPGDEVLIDIWGAAQNNYRKKVDREGAIRIENIGPIYVSGLSVEKAKEKIISYLKKIYSGIGVSGSSYQKVFAEVSLVGVRTVQVNIIGEVKVPGTYSLSALSTVLNALYASGGPTKNGTFRTIKVIRAGQPYSEFDIYKYLIEGSEKGNVMLQDQDVIIVQPYNSIVEVSGNIKRAGLYELKNGETIYDLIKFFGGFTADAYQERLLVERVNGKQKEVSEIVLKDQATFALQDGDVIKIGGVINRYMNRVSIGGAVYRPGTYELTNGLTLKGLLDKASGLKDNAFLDRGIIYRTIDDVNQEMVSFSVKQIMDKTSDITLKREDSVHVFSKESLKEKYTLAIDGAVNKETTIDFVDKMTVEDLIAVAGGLKEGADIENIDISRRVSDDFYKQLSINIKQTISSNLKLGQQEQFYLEPFDRVSVRYKKGYTENRNVYLEGEVNYPGTYTITDKNDRISDLVRKAGGLSPFANVNGATLIRKIDNSTQKVQLKVVKQLGEKDSIKNIENEDFVRIGIDLAAILKSGGEKSKYDLILNEGDLLVIPTVKQTVEVRGEILAPSIIRYDKSYSLTDFVNNSGGFTDNAKKRRTYVIYANGDIRSTKSFLFFKFYPNVEPGALIVVPQKPEQKDRMSLQEILGITTALSTIGVLINTFVK